MTRCEVELKREQYRIDNHIQKIENYGMIQQHNIKSIEIYDFISELDFANGDYFCFKSGGEGDNGEVLMTLLDYYFETLNYNKNNTVNNLTYVDNSEI